MATMQEKLHRASPFNIFYNEIPEIPETLQKENSISFADFLCPSLGKLKCSLQITSKIDLEWLMQQYKSRGVENRPLTILFGEDKPEMEDYIKKNLPNVTPYCVAVGDKFGAHHCKMAVYVYEDNSLRVVISSSNLYANHWNHFNHTFWVSPLCKQLPINSSKQTGESPTNFKSDLLHYLNQYHASSVLKPFIDQITKADFSDVKVCLVASYPGCHPLNKPGTHQQKMPELLRQHCCLTRDQQTWPVVIQSSCIGQFGESATHYLRKIFLNCLVGHVGAPSFNLTTNVECCIIYPTYKSVEAGHFGAEIGVGMRYSKYVHQRQKWLEQYLYQWKSDALGRSSVMPHSKLYARVSPCETKMAWFLLTSANVTRGAWGQKRPDCKGIFMRNYEVGVLFLPKFFGQDVFYLKENKNEEKIFPLLFDLPLIKYQQGDEPWTLEETTVSPQKVVLGMDRLTIN